MDPGPRPRPLGRPGCIASYLGETDAFDRAIAGFAAAYADLNERDHAILQSAAAADRVQVLTGI